VTRSLRLPAPTIRLRLTLVYGALFLICGVSLLTVTYFLVRQHYTGGFFLRSGRAAVVAISGGGGSGRAASVGGVSVRTGSPAVTVTSGKAPAAPNPEAVAAAANAQSAAALHQLLVDSGIALAIMALLSLWLGWLIAGRALRPLRTITDAAREISASSLHRRLDLKGPEDELKQLGSTFDDLLVRLEGSFEAQRQFVAHASHELRTPLTLERTILEVALRNPNDAAKLTRACERVIEVGEQQERLIEALLTLSRSQGGLDRHDPIDLAGMATAATADVEEAGLTLKTSLKPAQTSGNPRLVERLVANLVGNAIRHNIPGGTVSVETAPHADRAVLTVANTGPVIPPEEVARLFQPFQRLRNGRGSSPDGFGLGLSIVDAIAAAHAAILEADANEDGGLRITVSFPAASTERRSLSTPTSPPIAATAPTGGT
jgi:signal transduction histidine kinase